MIIEMRTICKIPGCGGTHGEVKPLSGQDRVFCTKCGKWQYHAPRREMQKAKEKQIEQPDGMELELTTSTPSLFDEDESESDAGNSFRDL